MRHLLIMNADPDEPGIQPGVEQAVRHLYGELLQLLGGRTQIVVTLLYETEKHVHVQAMATCNAARARQMLLAVEAAGFTPQADE